MSGRTAWPSTALGLALVVVLALLPRLPISVPGVLPGPTSTAGSLQLMALCFLLGALALTYNVLFGLTGLLSFGHALYFAVGVYVFAIALQKEHLPVVPAALLTLAAATTLAVLVGAISLRVTGISFAMVTLAFAQAGSVLVYQNPHALTGGEEGLGLGDARLPGAFVGVVNTQNLYWLALATLVVVYALVAWLSASRAGHLMAAVRENDVRVQVLGARPYAVRLIAFVVSGALAAVVGMAYLLLQGGANPQVTTPSFTLSLLVMVVLGGVGARWGAVLGGVIYTLLDQRLGVLASSHAIASLPTVLRAPLSQPLLILGVVFILVVLFLPGGIAGTTRRLQNQARNAHRRPARRRADLDSTQPTVINRPTPGEDRAPANPSGVPRIDS